MHLRRVLLATLAVSLAVTAAPAFAKARPKPVCNLLVDPEGDGKSTVGGDVIKSPALDIIGGDVATGAKTVVAVLRVKTTSTSGDNVALMGMRWSLNTSINGKDYTFTVSRSFGPTDGRNPSVSNMANGVLPVLTIQPNAYVFTVDRKGFDTLKPGGKILVKSAGSGVGFNNADGATSLKTYVDRTPSCVRAA